MLHAALDTSLGSSFAVANGTAVLCRAHLQTPPRDSDRELAPWIIRLLDEHHLRLADIRRWTVGTGPGSFAGLRFGIALLKGICAVTGAELRGVPSCQALADAAADQTTSPGRIGVLHDARCGQVIITVYEHQDNRRPRQLTEPAVCPPAQLPQPPLDCDSWTTAQPELLAILPKTIIAKTLVQPFPDATRLLPDYDGSQDCEPIYVRPPVFVSPQPVKTP